MRTADEKIVRPRRSDPSSPCPSAIKARGTRAAVVDGWINPVGVVAGADRSADSYRDQSALSEPHGERKGTLAPFLPFLLTPLLITPTSPRRTQPREASRRLSSHPATLARSRALANPVSSRQFPDR